MVDFDVLKYVAFFILSKGFNLEEGSRHFVL